MRRINMISLFLLYEPYIIKSFVRVCVCVRVQFRNVVNTIR